MITVVNKWISNLFWFFDLKMKIFNNTLKVCFFSPFGNRCNHYGAIYISLCLLINWSALTLTLLHEQSEQRIAIILLGYELHWTWVRNWFIKMLTIGWNYATLCSCWTGLAPIFTKLIHFSLYGCSSHKTLPLISKAFGKLKYTLCLGWPDVPFYPGQSRFSKTACFPKMATPVYLGGLGEYFTQYSPLVVQGIKHPK